jgi:outer membrane protein assembly factor BamB
VVSTAEPAFAVPYFRAPASWPTALKKQWQVAVGTGYATPIVVGNRVFVFTRQENDEVMTAYDARTFTQKNVVGVSAETGSLLWRRPYTTPSTTTSQTPILYKDMVIEMGRNNGITAFRAVPRGGQWTTEDVWHTDEVSMHMSDAVAIDGVLVGLSHLNSGQYFALDLETGRVLWKSDPRQAAHAAIARAGDTIFSLQDDSKLVVVRHNRTRFEPIVRYEVATSETWAQPVISGNRVFVKDVSSLTLWTLD